MQVTSSSCIFHKAEIFKTGLRNVFITVFSLLP
uniref:Uncharacterized protein n=1 Tax=Anguilla anguilla TaxID=7936 RepID=A0A0E9QQS9_ANGAN